MQVLREVTLDKIINLYEGVVVADRKRLLQDPELYRRKLRQDKMILGALKCARANGYSGEAE